MPMGSIGFLGGVAFPGRGRAEPESQADEDNVAADDEEPAERQVDDQQAFADAEGCEDADVTQDYPDEVVAEEEEEHEGEEAPDARFGDDDLEQGEDAVMFAEEAGDDVNFLVNEELAELEEGDVIVSQEPEVDPIDSQLQRLQDLLETAELREAGLTERLDQEGADLEDCEDFFDQAACPPLGFGPLDDPPPVMDDVLEICPVIGKVVADVATEETDFQEVSIEARRLDDAVDVSPTFQLSASPFVVVPSDNTAKPGSENVIRMQYLELIERAALQRKVLEETCLEIRQLEIKLGLDDDLSDRSGIELKNIKSFQIAMERAGLGPRTRKRMSGMPSALLRPEKRTREEINGVGHPLGAACKKAAQPLGPKKGRAMHGSIGNGRAKADGVDVADAADVEDIPI